jgi:hypothetical protein
MRLSQLEEVKLPDNEEQIKNLNLEKKKKFNKISEKIKNVESLNKISSTLAYQKHLIVKFYLFVLETCKEKES